MSVTNRRRTDRFIGINFNFNLCLGYSIFNINLSTFQSRMILNIATAALIYQNYQQNASNTYVGYTEYTLTITDLVLNCISVFASFMVISVIICCVGNGGRPKNEVDVKHMAIPGCLVLLNGPFNIAYSVFVIECYYAQRIVDEQLFNMSLAIIILNPIFLVIYLCA